MSRRHSSLSLCCSSLVLAWAALGCGSSTDSGAGGSTTSSTTTSSTTTSTTTEEVPLACTAGAWGGASLVVEQTTYGCLSTPNADVEFDAVVAAAGAASLGLDLCAPGTGCTSQPANVGVSVLGGGLSLAAVPVGAFVHVHYSQGPNGASGLCSHGITVRNLPSFGGAENPISTGSFLWLKLGYGVDLAATSGPDFGVSKSPVDCGGGYSVDTYHFYDPEEPTNAVDIPVGQTGTLTVHRTGGDQIWKMGNLVAGCGASGKLCAGELFPGAHWITQAPAP